MNILSHIETGSVKLTTDWVVGALFNQNMPKAGRSSGNHGQFFHPYSRDQSLIPAHVQRVFEVDDLRPSYTLSQQHMLDEMEKGDGTLKFEHLEFYDPVGVTWNETPRFDDLITSDRHPEPFSQAVTYPDFQKDYALLAREKRPGSDEFNKHMLGTAAEYPSKKENRYQQEIEGIEAVWSDVEMEGKNILDERGYHSILSKDEDGEIVVDFEKLKKNDVKANSDLLTFLNNEFDYRSKVEAEWNEIEKDIDLQQLPWVVSLKQQFPELMDTAE